MAPRKRKKKVVDEGPFLFSEEEMLGMITNVSVIESPVPEKAEIISVPETNEAPLTVTVDVTGKIESVNEQESESVNEQESESVQISICSPDTLSTDERIVLAMTNVLWQMKHMDKSQIRRIAFSITVMCQQGLDLNSNYSVPLIDDEEEISGYDLAAWCYCTFMSAFPSMQDKLQMPYAEHYEKAKADIGMN